MTISKYEEMINDNSVLSKIKLFVNSYYFIFVVGLIVLISNLFAIELICFSLLSLLGVTCLLLSKDTKGMISIILFFQMSFSYKNGLSYNVDDPSKSIFHNTNIIIYCSILISLVVMAAIVNIIIFKQYKNICKRTLCLIPGLICLSIGYSLAGIGQDYDINNFLFSLSNYSMIIGIFIYLTSTAFLEEKEDILKYLSMIMITSTIMIGLQQTYIYLSNNVIESLVINKDKIVTGWGISNNFAGYFVLSIPFIVYLALTDKHKIIYYLLLVLTAIFIIMSSSRNGIFILTLEAIVSIGIIIFHYKKNIKKVLIPMTISLFIALAVLIIFHDRIFSLFEHIINLGTSSNGRDELYKTAWNAFLESPIVGKGWFIHNGYDYIIPPNGFSPSFKTHNIFLQLLGSTGIIGLLGFLALVINIAYVTFKKVNSKKLVIFLAIIALVSSSIVDNFFFDYGFERYFAVFLSALSIYYYLDYKSNSPINQNLY